MRDRHKFILESLLKTVAAIIIVIAIGYLVTSFVYKFVGRPPEIIVNILSGIAGFTILAIFLFIINHIKKDEHLFNHTEMSDKVIKAINSISRGDFSVSVTIDERSPFSPLAEEINKMAKELGSMENLRQDFISNVSHEIQSPLTSISGFATLMKKDNLSTEKRNHYLDIIEAEAKRISKLSDNILKLSSLENNVQPLTLSNFSLDKQIENSILMLEPQWIKKNIDINISLVKTDFYGDESLLSQVWINILQNAIKFTKENENISVNLKNINDKIECCISDTGIGISSEDQMHIFERFYKADKSRDRSLGGNGLGLSIVKKIIELHNGNIFVTSKIGVGTTFKIVLPKLKI